MLTEWELRREICEIGQRIHARGLVAGTDGNISARVNGESCLISPSGSCLGMLSPKDLVLIDAGGRVLSGDGKPSSEYWMHLTAYERRPKITCAIHAHPPTVIALTLAGMPMPQCALPEIIISFGQVPIAQYATPATNEGADAIRQLITRYDALILDRHGSLTVGSSLRDAYFKLEKLEHGAEVIVKARMLGGVKSLPEDEVAKLAALREHFGLGSAEDIAPQCMKPGTVIPRITRGPDTY